MLFGVRHLRKNTPLTHSKKDVPFLARVKEQESYQCWRNMAYLPKNRKRIPPELVKELVVVLPFDIRWATARVCTSFDLFLLRTQFLWIKGEMMRQNVLREKRRQLENDQALLIQAAAGFHSTLLFSLIKLIASYFHVPDNYGLQSVGEEVTKEMFVQQLNAMLANLVNYEDENELYWRARFFSSITCNFVMNTNNGASPPTINHGKQME